MSNELAVSQASIPLEKSTIKQYLCQNATDQELALFLELCKVRGLNPFLKQAYLIKYGTEPATMVVAYDVLISKAESQPNYRGHNSGVTVISPSGEIIHTSGLVLPDHTLIGGWCEVHRDNRETLRVEVNLEEFVGRKKDGSITKMWDKMAPTMIDKVAVSKAHRRAYPSELQGMYAQEEITSESVDNIAYAEVPKKPEYRMERQEESVPSSPFVSGQVYTCSKCKSQITQKINEISTKTYGAALCMNHQAEAKAERIKKQEALNV